MWRDDAYLLDILLAAKDAQEFAEGLTWDTFTGSKLHQHAIVRALEIIGEAASKISFEYRQEHPEIPWREMIGLRNRLIHDYNRIRLDIVWQVLQQELPKLIATLESLVPPKEDFK
jgi:uncharacterized protein with HEPN domain